MKEYDNGRRVYIDIDVLMQKYNIEHLDVRHKKELLNLMFTKSKDATSLSVPSNNFVITRSHYKVKFVSDFTMKTRVQTSPLYRGIGLWDKLPKEIQKLDSKIDFKRAVKNLEM